jgi:hypothetical protein
MQNSDKWPEEMMRLYEEKSGIANNLVNWKHFTRAQLETCLKRIDRNHLVWIFDRLSRDLRENRTGFPDLVLFPDEISGGGYELVEVKGPGDALQKNQKRWLLYFQFHDIPVRVLNVAWK